MSHIQMYEGVEMPPRIRRLPELRGQHLTDGERSMFLTWVFELHAQRKNNAEIARETGLSVPTVKVMIKQGFEHFRIDVTEEFNKDISLLDDLLVVAIRRYRLTAQTRDYEAVDKILSRRARMLGYDREVTKIQAVIETVEPEDIELLELINTQRAKDARLKEALADKS